MPKQPTNADEYVAALPPDRRQAIEAVRGEINRRLPKGYEEGFHYGMISWCVPHRLYPAGYHCDPKQGLPFAALSSGKASMSLHLMSVYGSEPLRKWFESEWNKTGKRLDMGKACVRFKRLEDIPLPLIGETVAKVPVAEYVRAYEAARPPTGKRKT